MKKSMIYLMMAAIAMLFTLNIYSQGGNFMLTAGGSFPMADFADDDIDDENAGGAGAGFAVGAKYLYTLNEKGLGLFIEGNFMYNGLKSSYKDDLENEISDDGYYDIEIDKYPAYMNIPVFAGLNYTAKANEQISIYGEIGFGPTFLKITDLEVSEDGETATISTKEGIYTKFGFKLGAGLLINDKFIIGFNYCALGEHSKIESELKADGDTMDWEEFDRKVNLMTLTLGIKF